jgi:hypothetical protein
VFERNIGLWVTQTLLLLFDPNRQDADSAAHAARAVR